MYFHPLNFIRFILAIGVLLFHYGITYFPFNLPVLKTAILHSSFRVSFFFFISGFVMSLVYGKNTQNFTAKGFYKKRFTRIAPVYWLAFLITVLVVVFIKDASPKGLVIILQALGLQSWNPGYVLDLNFTTWSISVELFFYSLFPFLLMWTVRQSTRYMLLAGILVWLLQSLQHYYFVNYLSDGSKKIEEFISAFPLWHLGTFFAGIITAQCVVKETIPSAFKKNALIFLFASILIFVYIIYVPNPFLKYIHNGLLAPVYALFILALYYDTSIVHRTLSLPLFSRFGDLSYGIFIFQYPLWLISTAFFSKEFQTTAWFFFIYLMIVLIVSFTMNRFFEKPMLLYLRKQKSKPVS